MYFIAEGSDVERHPALMRQMFALRARVFGERLGWVDVAGEEERDRYDDLCPVYLLHTDAAARHLYAAARFLPTTGPTLLSDVFAETVPDAALLASPFVWECTRLCLDDDKMRAHGRHGERLDVLRAMLIAGVEFGVEAGVEAFLANFDDVRLRTWRRAGARIDVIGTAPGFGHGPVHLGLMEVSAAALADLSGRLRRPLPVLAAAPCAAVATAA